MRWYGPATSRCLLAARPWPTPLFWPPSWGGWRWVTPGWAGGPIESFIRNLRQEGAVTELAMPEIPKRIVESIDAAYLNTLTTATYILPRYPEFNTVDKVAYGFNINNSLVARHCLITLAYFFVIAVLGYFILRTRELAA